MNSRYYSADVIENFNADKDSRAEWESMFERGFDLLGLKLEEGSEPFQGACTAVHPLLIESAVKFQSKASGELFPAYWSLSRHRYLVLLHQRKRCKPIEFRTL